MHERVYDEFLDAADRQGARRDAPTTAPDAKIGPITMPEQLDVIRRHIDDALARGGRAVVGGADAVGDRFVQPTVLVDVPEDSAAVQEETFGPTVTVAKVARHGRGGRARPTRPATGWARRCSRRRAAWSSPRGSASGMTAVNGVITFAGVPSLPFGGVGDSGFGRIHGPDGLKEFTYAKAIARQRFKPLLALTTFARTEKAEQQLAQMITMLHGRGSTLPK